MYAEVMDNDHSMLVALKEGLGLCSFFQDELLRIEEMLAKDDPKLESLLNFQSTYPRVVETLTELNAKGRVIQSINWNTKHDSQAISDVNRSMGVQLDPTIVKAINKQVTGMEAASSSQTATTGTEAIDLIVRHNKVSIVSNIDLSVTHNKVSIVSNIDLSVRHNEVSIVFNIDLSVRQNEVSIVFNIDRCVRHNKVSMVSNIYLSVRHNKISMVSNIDLSDRHNKVSIVSYIDLSVTHNEVSIVHNPQHWHKCQA